MKGKMLYFFLVVLIAMSTLLPNFTLSKDEGVFGMITGFYNFVIRPISTQEQDCNDNNLCTRDFTIFGRCMNVQKCRSPSVCDPSTGECILSPIGPSVPVVNPSLVPDDGFQVQGIQDGVTPCITDEDCGESSLSCSKDGNDNVIKTYKKCNNGVCEQQISSEILYQCSYKGCEEEDSETLEVTDAYCNCGYDPDCLASTDLCKKAQCNYENKRCEYVDKCQVGQSCDSKTGSCTTEYETIDPGDCKFEKNIGGSTVICYDSDCNDPNTLGYYYCDSVSEHLKIPKTYDYCLGGVENKVMEYYIQPNSDTWVSIPTTCKSDEHCKLGRCIKNGTCESNDDCDSGLCQNKKCVEKCTGEDTRSCTLYTPKQLMDLCKEKKCVFGSCVYEDECTEQQVCYHQKCVDPCSDDDSNNNQYKKGTVTGIWGGNTESFEDYCSNGILVQRECGDGPFISQKLDSRTCGQNEVCSLGRCIKEGTCEVNDDCEDGESCVADKCVVTCTKNEDCIYFNWVCDEDQGICVRNGYCYCDLYDGEITKNNCESGYVASCPSVPYKEVRLYPSCSCVKDTSKEIVPEEPKVIVPEEPTCEETDGSDIYTRGTTKGKLSEESDINEYEDKCGFSMFGYTFNKEVLEEYYCENGFVKIKRIKCENGCKDGACILSDNTICEPGEYICNGGDRNSLYQCNEDGDTYQLSKHCSSGCCDGKCVDLKTDALNCGTCGKACALGQTCCNGECVYLQNDEFNCKKCGKVCGLGQSCCSGECVTLLNDAFNCGKCGKVCALGQSCSNGECVQPEEPTCEETDGSDIYTRGTTKGKLSEESDINEYEDKCGFSMFGYTFNKEVLQEYYCENGLVKIKRIKCENGCKDGACSLLDNTICEPGEYICNGGDGNDLYQCNEDGDTYQLSKHCSSGCCDGKCVDLKTDEDNCGKCGTVCAQGQTCEDGACVTEQQEPESDDVTCVESDGLNNPYIKGTITGLNYNNEQKTLTDSCNGNILTEYYCSNNKISNTTVDCASLGLGYICANGECARSCLSKYEACEDAECGTVDNGCGVYYDCGNCQSGYKCTENVCVIEQAEPVCTSGEFSCGGGDGNDLYQCNEEGDNYQLLEHCSNGCCDGKCVDLKTDANNCGECAHLCGNGYTCVVGKCERYKCVPLEPMKACGVNVCGEVDDGCGGTYNCGMCQTGYNCIYNVCIKDPCDDGNPCTTDYPNTYMGGCYHEEKECPQGQICSKATGKCVDEVIGVCTDTCLNKQCGRFKSLEGYTCECGKCGVTQECNEDGQCVDKSNQETVGDECQTDDDCQNEERCVARYDPFTGETTRYCELITCNAHCSSTWECGDDGCGGSCGTCGAGEKCVGHKCFVEYCGDFGSVSEAATSACKKQYDTGLFAYNGACGDKAQYFVSKSDPNKISLNCLERTLQWFVCKDAYSKPEKPVADCVTECSSIYSNLVTGETINCDSECVRAKDCRTDLATEQQGHQIGCIYYNEGGSCETTQGKAGKCQKGICVA